MLTIQLESVSVTATVSCDTEVHPDLLDEMCARCVRLFHDASLDVARLVTDPEVEVDGAPE